MMIWWPTLFIFKLVFGNIPIHICLRICLYLKKNVYLWECSLRVRNYWSFWKLGTVEVVLCPLQCCPAGVAHEACIKMTFPSLTGIFMCLRKRQLGACPRLLRMGCQVIRFQRFEVSFMCMYACLLSFKL